MKTALKHWYLYGGSSTNSTYQSILDKADAIGATIPNSSIQSKDNAFWGGLSEDGNLSLMDIAYLFGSSGSEEYCRINGVDPDVFYPTKNGTINWTAEGGSAGGGAATDYYSTGYNPSTSSKFLQNNNSFGLYTKVDLLTASKNDMGIWRIETTGQGCYLSARNTGDVYRSQNNNATGSSTSGATSSIGLTSCVRVGSTEYKIYKNGVDAGTVTQSSAAIQSLVWAICGAQGATAVYANSNRQIAFTYAGSGSIDQLKLYNRLVTRFS